MANNYGWWWTIKVMCDFDPFKEDLIYKWNIRRFYNQLVFMSDMDVVKEKKRTQEKLNKNK